MGTYCRLTHLFCTHTFHLKQIHTNAALNSLISQVYLWCPVTQLPTFHKGLAPHFSQWTQDNGYYRNSMMWFTYLSLPGYWLHNVHTIWTKICLIFLFIKSILALIYNHITLKTRTVVYSVFLFYFKRCSKMKRY